MRSNTIKLIIQIPCLNEEETLPLAVASLPKSIKGIDQIEILVIDDGSTDRTSAVARSLGVQHLVRFPSNLGLANAFAVGLLKSAELGADIVVNYDADCQYDAADIETIVRPILQNSADIVIGERPIDEIAHFSWTKKMLQKVGSYIIGVLSGVSLRDTPSGFRAFNRNAMLKLHVLGSYTYTQETIITATQAGLILMGVPIRVNDKVLRASRLVKSTLRYTLKAGLGYMKIFLLYKPFYLLAPITVGSGLCCLILLARFFHYYFTGNGSGWIQSLIIASMFFVCFSLSVMLLVLAQLLTINRLLAMRTLSELRIRNFKN